LLVVDDQPANTTLLAEMLRSWGFTTVTATNDSASAVGLCEELEPDLLFLDLHMPGRDPRLVAVPPRAKRQRVRLSQVRACASP
jgi:CheY-like chemotaxis protein